MMSGDNFSGGSRGDCPALGDVTNRPVKRGFSLVSDDSGAKSQDRRGKCRIDGGGDAASVKQVCLGVENLVKGKCTTRHDGHGVKKGTIPFFKDKKARGSSPVHDKLSGASHSVFSAVVRSQETLNVSHSSPKVLGIEMNARSVLEVADASRDSCTSIVSTLSSQVGEKSSEGIKVRNEHADVVKEVYVDPIRESSAQGPITQVLSNCDEGLRIGKLASNSSGSIEWSRLPNSQGLKNFELIRCQTLEGNGCDNLCAEEDLLKSCSCSFCLKAAYMWSDLHYQDIKGRISVSKSRKEANTLVQKTAMAKDVIHVSGNSNKSPNLEYVLTNQWRSLFLRMEDILVHEGRELQSSYCELKDMREKCKMDLDSTNRMPSNRH
ncbi:uncharacterized protein LOC115738895 isoform X2 [Rhodamnia argentea]|uniref:Uncharacterized protein LOC115738895 isoform X2 n=1 Tax=Rhodamnia argentea TaxID=178133 RepID=A0A8B8P0W1_9MYRT|nr:uncharacterized protein LOC115738895 isoform X2 [Rhodamnia argentea]